MCFDFHLSDENPKLIEINTNASSSITSWLLGEAEGKFVNSKPYLELLECAIKEETNSKCNMNIAIIDDDFKNQASYFEFIYYKKLFENMGHRVFICDPKDLVWKNERLLFKDINLDFVYNRCCDFLFEKNLQLKEAFLCSKVCFSPNPHEYNLLANKQRMIELTREEFLNKLGLSEKTKKLIQSTVPQTFEVMDFSFSELKKIKHKFVFKPKTLFGSKLVYVGKSISNIKLSKIYNSNFLAQTYIRPPTWEEFKYDLRIYTYKSDIHLVSARLYKGQVTNARTKGGGFSSVEII